MAGEKSGEAEGGQTGGGQIPTGSITDLEKQVAAAIKLADEIDLVGERSILGEVQNLTRFELTLVGNHHESGGFAGALPKDVIPARGKGDAFSLFGSKNSNPLAGTVGTVTYRASDGAEFLCEWHNPFVGSNKISYSVRGFHPGLYDVRITAGGGNKRASMRWVIFPLPEPFSVRDFVRHHGTTSVRALPASANSSVRNLMGL